MPTFRRILPLLRRHAGEVVLLEIHNNSCLTVKSQGTYAGVYLLNVQNFD